MRTIIFSTIFICYITNIFAQEINVDSIINYAKTQLKSENNGHDYKTTADLLEKVVQILPKNAEVYYLLGYLYEAINSNQQRLDGSIIRTPSLELTLKASIAIEKSIELESKYTGETMYLDPYAKLSSIWGWYAFVQHYKGNIDSAKWALSEGQKRGGFSKYSLSHYCKVLEKCSNNAILFTYGDISCFSIFYLQLINNIRTDITHIELSQISVPWYIQFLRSQKKLPFSITPEQCQKSYEDGYREWESEPLAIETPHREFIWTPITKFENYLLWNEEILIDLIKTNKFKKDIFFITGVAPDFYLGLNDFFISNFISDRINYDNQEDLPINQIIKLVEFIYNDIDLFNSVYTDDFNYILLNNRINILTQINKYLKQNKVEEAYLLYERFTSLDNIEEKPYLAKHTTIENFHKEISNYIMEHRQADNR